MSVLYFARAPWLPVCSKIGEFEIYAHRKIVHDTEADDAIFFLRWSYNALSDSNVCFGVNVCQSAIFIMQKKILLSHTVGTVSCSFHLLKFYFILFNFQLTIHRKKCDQRIRQCRGVVYQCEKLARSYCPNKIHRRMHNGIQCEMNQLHVLRHQQTD